MREVNLRGSRAAMRPTDPEDHQRLRIRVSDPREGFGNRADPKECGVGIDSSTGFQIGKSIALLEDHRARLNQQQPSARRHAQKVHLHLSPRLPNRRQRSAER
jgi:hypothetical protein